MGAGTLYGALKTLSKNGWIEQTGTVKDARGKKEYKITPTGKAVFDAEVSRLKELLSNAERIKHYEEISSDF